MSTITEKKDLKLLLNYLEVLPNHKELRKAIAECYYQKYQYHLALEYYISIEDSYALDKDLLKNMGYSYAQTQDKKTALTYYTKAYLLDTIDTGIIDQVCNLSKELEDYETAVEYYEKWLAISPNDTWLLDNQGWCYQYLKKYDMAIDLHLKSHQINRSGSWNLDNIAFCYLKKQDFETALDYFGKSIQIYSYNSWNIRQQGWCYFALGNLHEAEQKYEDALKLDKTLSEYTLMNLGHFALSKNDMEKAIDYYQKSILKYKTTNKFIEDFEDDYQYIIKHISMQESEYHKIKEDLLLYYEKNIDNVIIDDEELPF